ncbi:MAG: DUF302 domain-containing protein [Gammaproteobacteria bacterium]|nr:DUF302 domain-containing protein [Gammaproteobacteria bacterium]
MRLIQSVALTLAVFLGVSSPLYADAEGLVVVSSPHGVEKTLDKLTTVLESKGMKIMARVNHAAGAASADLTLRPTEVLIFGNPKVGTPLMNCSQSIAIDLPQKMLAWEDADGKVWLGYNDPAYLKGRHTTEGCDGVFDKVSGALANFAKAATAP